MPQTMVDGAPPSPLVTPRPTRNTRSEDGYPTPPRAPRPMKSPPLLAAMQRNSLTDVEQALAQEPELASLASFRFMDHSWEPPLCAAARLGCSEHIAQTLLQHGADPEATDIYGRSPSAILHFDCNKPVCFLQSQTARAGDLGDAELSHEELIDAFAEARRRHYQQPLLMGSMPEGMFLFPGMEAAPLGGA
mmetsp:Transcript_42938/g.98583  ORF Transcript_42938/g.98583 Transcript_42938/m.98583 type:complete len:191 (+) Transcript_42938:110-682(+)